MIRDKINDLKKEQMKLEEQLFKLYCSSEKIDKLYYKNPEAYEFEKYEIENKIDKIKEKIKLIEQAIKNGYTIINFSDKIFTKYIEYCENHTILDKI